MSHDCSLCPINLCKKKALNDYIENSQIQYDSILYFGDGSIDFCPAKSLSNKDYVLARKGLALEKKMVALIQNDMNPKLINW